MPQNHHKIVQITTRGPKPPPQTNCSQASVVPKLSTSTARAGDPPPLWRPIRVHHGAYHLGTAGQRRGPPSGPFETLFPLPFYSRLFPPALNLPKRPDPITIVLYPAPPACTMQMIAVRVRRLQSGFYSTVQHIGCVIIHDTTMQVRPSCAGSLHAHAPPRHRPNNSPASMSVSCIVYLPTHTHHDARALPPVSVFFYASRVSTLHVYSTRWSHLCATPPTPSSLLTAGCVLSPRMAMLVVD